MMKIVKTFGTILFGTFLLTACGDESPAVTEQESTKISEEVTEQAPTEAAPAQEYEIVAEKKAEDMEALGLQVAADAMESAEFQSIVEEIIENYRSEELDSLHIYLYETDGDSIGKLKALAGIAYTEEGIANIGTENVNAYEIEYEEWVGLEDYVQLTPEEGQVKILENAFKEAEKYYQSAEENGSLSAEQLEELATIIEEQTNQLTDETKKEKVSQMVNLIRENRLEEAGSVIDELEE